MQILPDHDLVCEAKRRKAEDRLDFVRKYFDFVGTGDREYLRCKHCGRMFAVVEVFTIRLPGVLLSHPVPGRSWGKKGMCGVREAIK